MCVNDSTLVLWLFGSTFAALTEILLLPKLLLKKKLVPTLKFVGSSVSTVNVDGFAASVVIAFNADN